ncbi:MAG TPA: TOBE domain-containing protein [Gemmatimonadaceae bacterium]|jgi:molybdopterin-binding protein|nr:TOBE domain-containing protein [Gemmatimonadaceae bacterium]
MADDLLTARQVADLLHMHIKRVQLLARQGKLPTVRHGRRWLFPRASILAAPAEASGGIDLSARNQLRGRVRSLRSDGLMMEVAITLAPQEVVALITKASAERLGLSEGVEALAVIKATEIMVARKARR